MARYVYHVPYGVEIKGKHRQIGVAFGKRVIVAKNPIDGLDRYLVRAEGVVEEKVEETKEPVVKYTREELEAMKYREVQEIAKEMGLKYKGKKVEIIERILEAQKE